MLIKFLRKLFNLLCRVEVRGIENYHQAGKRVLIVVNRLSFLDSLLIGVFLPEKVMFAVNSHVPEKWYFKPFLSLVEIFLVDPSNPLCTKHMIREIMKDKKCVIFPEGRLTTTGTMMKIYAGPSMIADKSQARILPIRIEAAPRRHFSRLNGKIRLRLFPQITMQILPSHEFIIDPELTGRQRRHVASLKLYDLMTDMMFDTTDRQLTLFQKLLEQTNIHGRKYQVLEDVNRAPITYGQLLTHCAVLGHKFEQVTEPGEYVGILLPNMISTVATFFALQSQGRIPAMLNFSTGSKVLVSVCETAQIKRVYTSQQFIDKGNLHPLVDGLVAAGVAVCYLEELAETISIVDKVKGLIKSYQMRSADTYDHHQDVNAPAVVLFTSGSEGTPKGVVLSHHQIQANMIQLSSRVDIVASDRFFNAMPVFHSFGLTSGLLMPLLAGVPVFLYPSPLHYRIVPELVYDTNATVMFGTDTFLNGYARFANSYDFYSIRYVFAGAEKLKPETQQFWSQNYGVRIFEGYGTTETAPVLATNTPMHCKTGTVGRLLPRISYQLEPVPGIEEGGRLVVKGPNVMMGYLFHDQPGKLVPAENQTYDTGDIVKVDSDGFLTILGRAKRFSKIAGEMVSLTAVETYLSEMWPGEQHAVVSIADAKKGEALFLFTTRQDASFQQILAYTKQNGISELFAPRKIKHVDALPILGTGKVDYVTAQQMAQQEGSS